MKKLLIVLIFLFTSYVFSQGNEERIDSIISIETNQLLETGITDFFVVKSYCFNMLRSNDNSGCNISGTKYLAYIFWNSKKKYYVRKIDMCGRYELMKIRKGPLSFFRKNIGQLNEETMHFYSLGLDSIVGDKVYSTVLLKNHTCHRKFQFYNDDKIVKKRFDFFWLTNEAENPNVYFESNNKLSIVKLNDICDTFINELEKENKFVRTEN
ncbi:MAG: hypothetical protein QM478_03030 [Flavobacteriaceae bacterium]